MQTISQVLKNLNIPELNPAYSTGAVWGPPSGSDTIDSYSPVDGKKIASVQVASGADYEKVMKKAADAFIFWRSIPAPKRGEIVRQFGDALRRHKTDLGTLVSYEMGKSLQEGLGEVQEMIDICDFAVGLSRQLYGLTMHSERPGHRMYEQWHPLGVVGIISAFNFPVAVWSWNTALAWVCGNVCVWKPSEKTPVTAIACQHIIAGVFKTNDIPEGVSNLIIGDKVTGGLMTNDNRVALISATGSTRMGKEVGVAVAARLGKSLLELGGNNAIIISEHADLDMSLIGAVFGAVGTAGQRCTSTRRLIIHESVYDVFTARLVKAYGQLRIGNPLDEHNHVGPLIDSAAVTSYLSAIEKCKAEGGRFIVEGAVLEGPDYTSGCYVRPCIAEVENDYKIVQHETFAPILYLIKYKTQAEAIVLQNGVPQGLS
ncbi:MAG TPA: aldehyde dehydrogenase family protein, partial [Pedobacter sp.]|uniref:aldehyde dehydrogenase family protein n=1 Tax=Pedobacter sp. TaxID=1411316 RepID=UPI002B65F7CE